MDRLSPGFLKMTVSTSKNWNTDRVFRWNISGRLREKPGQMASKIPEGSQPHPVPHAKALAETSPFRAAAFFRPTMP